MKVPTSLRQFKMKCPTGIQLALKASNTTVLLFTHIPTVHDKIQEVRKLWVAKTRKRKETKEMKERKKSPASDVLKCILHQHRL